ncbi:hypothetical protein JJ691_92040 [Kutzneria sp. CA-103260]|nr:hypothetical protein JJ691_92040 [Kutzneria sp. CA-103260]
MIRNKGPVDEDFDIEANIAWAGVLPLSSQWGVPESDPSLARAGARAQAVTGPATGSKR